MLSGGKNNEQRVIKVNNTQEERATQIRWRLLGLIRWYIEYISRRRERDTACIKIYDAKIIISMMTTMHI